MTAKTAGPMTPPLDTNTITWLHNVRAELGGTRNSNVAGAAHPLHGCSLEGAQVGKLLGVGNFAIVFDLHDPADNRSLAVKVLKRSTVVSRTSVHENESFRREVDIGMKLEHPAITRIHRFSEKTNSRFVVLDKVDGQTFASLLDEPLSVARYRELFAPLAKALDYAHAMGVVHRDLKPENIMIASDGMVKVLDFGLARHKGSKDVTLTGEFKGTPKYCAPEQAMDSKKVGPATDQFAFALLSFQMLTGKFPYPEDPKRPLDTLLIRLQQPAASLSSVWPEATAGADAAIARMLSIRPDQRFPSVEEAFNALSREL